MEHSKTTILSTRPLDPAQIALAAGRGIILEAISFIRTEIILPDPRSALEMANLYEQSVNVVFTSMNAVEALGANRPDPESGEEKSRWRIFCIGQATRQRAIHYFGERAIAGTADSALALADTILAFFDKQPAEPVPPGVVFFCGDQRREELPNRLRMNSVNVVERVVYRTIGTPHTLKKAYDGILFFSPSAVDSFFISNTLPEITVLFSIGATTAAAIAKHSPNKVIVGESPAKEMLVRQALDFFTKP